MNHAKAGPTNAFFRTVLKNMPSFQAEALSRTDELATEMPPSALFFWPLEQAQRLF
jgi:hypothetical protein